MFYSLVMPLAPDSYPARCGEIVDRCAEIDRRIAGLEAEKAALLGERVQLLLAEVPPGSAGFEQAERSMFAEIAAGLRISRGAAARALGVGWSPTRTTDGSGPRPRAPAASSKWTSPDGHTYTDTPPPRVQFA